MQNQTMTTLETNVEKKWKTIVSLINNASTEWSIFLNNEYIIAIFKHYFSVILHAMHEKTIIIDLDRRKSVITMDLMHYHNHAINSDFDDCITTLINFP